ncbi:hypothetical protein BWK60_07740 [Flavobacterium covae]|uniref:hypothetical protein n=1 Tax=Flavobacterium covae TaxID=2906076 RepID=UPI000B4CAD85|nr:hypothetical protein [Flavobacterium covae]OWP86664.1 hypothetical protein BWK60_07740 [Flavobacterium covae]
MTDKLSPENEAETKPLLGDVPFTDTDGKPIFVGDIIEQTNFNGEQYLARYEVAIDPADNEVCLFMLQGNEKAMKLLKSYKYSAFGSVINGKLRKGRVIGRIA